MQDRTASLNALGAAILFGASTPFAKQLIGEGTGLSFPFLLAGMLYLGSGIGLAFMRLVRDRGWKAVDMPGGSGPGCSARLRLAGCLGRFC